MATWSSPPPEFQAELGGGLFGGVARNEAWANRVIVLYVGLLYLAVIHGKRQRAHFGRRFGFSVELRFLVGFCLCVGQLMHALQVPFRECAGFCQQVRVAHQGTLRPRSFEVLPCSAFDFFVPQFFFRENSHGLPLIHHTLHTFSA